MATQRLGNIKNAISQIPGSANLLMIIPDDAMLNLSGEGR
jgi:hypothetical protein